MVTFFIKGTTDRALKYDKLLSVNRFAPDLDNKVDPGPFQTKNFTKTFSLLKLGYLSQLKLLSFL